MRGKTAPDIFDRCHKYGWMVTLAGTILVQVVLWAYSVGSFRQSIDDMKLDFGNRISRLEQQVDKVLERP